MVSVSVCSIVFGKPLLEQDVLFLGSGCIPRYMFFHLAIILFFNFFVYHDAGALPQFFLSFRVVRNLCIIL